MINHSSNLELEEDPRSFVDGLWRQASTAGAFIGIDKRALGTTNDM